MLPIFCSFASNIASIFVVVFSGLVPAIINSTDPLKIQEYPSYLWVYIHHNVSFGTATSLIMLIYYYKKPKLRDYIKRHFLQSSHWNHHETCHFMGRYANKWSSLKIIFSKLLKYLLNIPNVNVCSASTWRHLKRKDLQWELIFFGTSSITEKKNPFLMGKWIEGPDMSFREVN